MKRIPRILVAIENSREYGRGLIEGISKYARVHGPWMFVTRPEYYHGGSHIGKSLAFLLKGRIDGVIMREVPPEDMQVVLARKVPVIVANHLREQSALPNIITDGEKIGRIGAAHFLERGFRNLAFCGMGPVFWSVRRGEGFAKAVAEAGYETHVNAPPRAKRNRMWDRELPVLAKWLEELPYPIGVMAPTDDRARDVIEACEFTGLKVPEEVAVLGVDNDALVCDLAGVPISSIALNVRRAGYKAADLLDKMMKSRKKLKKQSIMVSPTHVEVRRSTDLLAIEDPHVAKALNYINSHANEPLQVAEVARVAGLSQRHLFDLFQATLGRSVYKQITLVRVGRICWLLENTAMSVLEIALTVGLPDDKHLSRYFQRQKGITPTVWRRRYGSAV